jgi:imidazolonepropionase-like amidohydrolase
MFLPLRNFTFCAALVTLSVNAGIAQNLVITNVTVVSPETGISNTAQDVLVKDGRITQIGKISQTDANESITLDGRGKYLTPGLMDSHVHITSVTGMGAATTATEVEHPDLGLAYYQQQPLSFLYHGITQVLDPGATLDFTKFTDQPVRPDFFRCGGIPNLGGYPQMPISEAMQKFGYYVIDDSYKGTLPSTINLADHTPEAVVAKMKADGAICVKLYLEDGFGAASQWPLFTMDTLHRIQAAAEKNGLPTVAHANAIDMYQIAQEVGIDILGHGLWNWQWDEAKNGPSPLESVLEKIIQDNQGYMPTISTMVGLQQVLLPETLDNPDLKMVTPKALLEWYQTDEAKFFKKELVADFGPQATPESAAEMLGYGVGRVLRVTALLSQASHPILLASDFPGSPSFANQPGLTTLQEMRQLADSGISLKAILQAGTINNARQFGLEDKFGTVEIGKVANLLLLDANPLETIEAWNQIDTVILHGKAIDRSTLAANRQ